MDSKYKTDLKQFNCYIKIQFLLICKDPSESYVGKNAIMSGWGEAEKFLKAMSLTVISQDKCRSIYAKSKVKITKDHICIFGKNEAGNHGDSGGILL